MARLLRRQTENGFATIGNCWLLFATITMDISINNWPIWPTEYVLVKNKRTSGEIFPREYHGWSSTSVSVSGPRVKTVARYFPVDSSHWKSSRESPSVSAENFLSRRRRESRKQFIIRRDDFYGAAHRGDDKLLSRSRHYLPAARETGKVAFVEWFPVVNIHRR